MKPLLAELPAKIETLDLTAARLPLEHEQLFDSVKALVPESIDDPLTVGGFGLEVLWHWLQAALVLRKA